MTDTFQSAGAVAAQVVEQIGHDEIWRKTNVCGGRFEVSNLGHVRNARSRRHRRPNDRSGYVRVRLEGRFYSVHRLVVDAFLPEDPSRPFTNHKDGNKANNIWTNLERVTQSENTAHAYETGLCTARRGSSNGASKLTEDQVIEIRRRYEAGGIRQVDLADEYGCCQHNISLIVRREKWAHV